MPTGDTDTSYLQDQARVLAIENFFLDNFPKTNHYRVVADVLKKKGGGGVRSEVELKRGSIVNDVILI